MLNMILKNIKLLPVITFSALVFYCWYQLIINSYFPTAQHIMALVFLITNIVVYFWDYTKGLIVTFFVLLMAALSFIGISFEIISHSYFIKMGSIKFALPPLNFSGVLIFVFYCIVNFETVKIILKRITKLF